ncbi:MAG: flagellar basal body rod protein FlgC [Shewanellaceae bacterium]|nr:flagellar basal body rod protein FlgC [Shewanellaceae bacterium]
MSLYNIFNVAGMGMSSQSVRLNTTASNIANATSVSSSINETYRAREPIFAAIPYSGPTVNKYDQQYRIEQPHQVESAFENIYDRALLRRHSGVGVKVKAIVESDKPIIQEYRPNHPMANEQGYIFKPNVNVMEEMANMISASKSYQMNVQVADSAKQMLMKTLTLGQA